MVIYLLPPSLSFYRATVNKKIEAVPSLGEELSLLQKQSTLLEQIVRK
jgi:hypothetical protein